MITYKQLTLADIFDNCQEILDSDKPAFLSLLENHINLDSIIPIPFRNHFYASTLCINGQKPQILFSFYALGFIIQRIFSIPTDSLLLVFLNYSKELRDFCGFSKIPDASKITRFKQGFLLDLQSVFENLVDLTEPICQEINSAKANNFDSNYDPYKAAYSSTTSHASSNNQVKLLYVDGHFCYVYKIGIITNGLGIIRHLDFYNRDFLIKHPELEPNKKSNS